MKSNLDGAYYAERLEEVLTRGQWVTGSNIQSEIETLSLDMATQKVASLNTIADLVFHLDYYLYGVLTFFQGAELTIRDKYSFDAPVLTSEKDWKERIAQFATHAGEFIKLVEKMDRETLQKSFVKAEYGSYGRNIDVLIEHSYYHFGQIVLIKKMLRQEAAN